MPRPKPQVEEIRRLLVPPLDRRPLLRLDMNESPDGLPAGFVEEVRAAIDPALLATYPTYDRLTALIADHVRCPPETIGLSNGSDSAIKQLFDAYISPGDRILLTDPTFAMYPIYSRLFDARVEAVPYAGDLSFPEDAFLERVKPGVRLVIVVSPNNPTGTAMTRAQLDALAVRTRDVDAMLLVDEAYHYFHPETVVDIVGRFPHMVVTRTFSKLCGLAAARMGYFVAAPEVTEFLRRVKPTYDVNGLGVLFAERLLSTPGLLERLVRDAVDGREWLSRQLADRGIPHRTGAANFILIECKDRTRTLMEALAARGVLTSGGFSQPFLRDFLRVTVGSVEVMRRFWNEFEPLWSGSGPA